MPDSKPSPSAFLCSAFAPAVLAQQVSTAQSVMFSTDLSGDFVIEASEVWTYNRSSAKSLFTNTWDGNPPTVTCSGSPSACSNPAPPARGERNEAKAKSKLGTRAEGWCG
jgi:hypothetical protein